MWSGSRSGGARISLGSRGRTPLVWQMLVANRDVAALTGGPDNCSRASFCHCSHAYCARRRKAQSSAGLKKPDVYSRQYSRITASRDVADV